MRESIGSTFLYNIIFIFIIIVFGLITATLNYYKGYKVNTRILQAIQRNSGYNSSSKTDIDRVLKGIGYTIERNGIQNTCPSRDGKVAITSNKAGAGDTSYFYCVYYYENESGANDNGKTTNEGKSRYYSYGVTTYIYIDLPIVGQIKIPVFTKGERIYRFSGNINCQRGADC